VKTAGSPDGAARLRLHWEVHGGSGPFLLLVHGLLSGRSQWLPNLPALRTVARPVIVELWGHGRSPAPLDFCLYHPDRYVELFDEIRKALGAQRWFLCGQSLGAALTLRYALEHPERVLGQVFTNSTSALADAAWVAEARALAPALAGAIEREGTEALERMPIHPRHAKRIPPEVHRELLADAARVDPRGIARAFQVTVPESTVRERIGENRVPTLLVCGERESRFRPQREFAELRMPCLEVVRVDAGHAPNLEVPPAFDAAVTAFLGRLRSAGAES
jgi:pimeloyl-ACP methyl ester carboxylesterase